MQEEALPEMPLIERARRHDSSLLADILSDSFLDDPVMNWVIPDRRLYPGFYRMLIAGTPLSLVFLRRDVPRPTSSRLRRDPFDSGCMAELRERGRERGARPPPR